MSQDRVLSRTVPMLALLTCASWSTAVKQFGTSLLHVVFLPRIEEVNRHLSRKSLWLNCLEVSGGTFSVEGT